MIDDMEITFCRLSNLTSKNTAKRNVYEYREKIVKRAN